MTILKLSFAAVLLTPLLAAVPAQAETFRSAYTVSYLGIPVARSNFTSSFSGDRFTVEGELSSAGLGQIFDSTKGRIKVSGNLASERARADSYRIDYTSGKKKKHTEIRFANGVVSGVENVPPLKARKKKWVEVSPEDLKSVADPISATLVRAPSLEAVCDRTIRVFDGEMRVDLKLSAKEKGKWNGQPTLSCKVGFVPVSGYRRGKDSLEYLQKKSAIEIEFTALGKTGMYAPVRASVGTEIGTVTVSADEISAAN